MTRTILLVVSGAAIGAAAVLFAHHLWGSSDRSPIPAPLAPEGASPAAAVHDADRAEATTVDDAASLEEQAIATAAEPPSAGRSLRLAALLLRHAEADPAAAARLGKRLRVDAALTRLLFAAWAERDPEAAIGELGTLLDTDEAREIAAAMLRTLGSDERNVARLAAALPAGERNAFLAEAVAARAETSPLAALRQALAIADAQTRTAALVGLARAWARQDPRQALLDLHQLADASERDMFRDSVLAVWAQTEPAAALDYALDLDGAARERAVLALVHQLPDAELTRVVADAARFDGALGATLRQTAIQRLAQSDPAAALAQLDALPAHERRQAHNLIASAYGERDPEAAFAWARSLQPRDPQVLIGVLNGIAQTDPERAFDLALSLESATERELAVGVVSSIGPRGGAAVEKMLSRALGLDDSGLRERALLGLLGSWSYTEPERAFEWLAANQTRVSPQAFQQVGMQLAMRAPDLATEYLARVPQDARGAWLAAVATARAQRDPATAVEWIAQYRADPAFPQVIAPVATALAQHDAAAAVRLLEEHGALDPSNPDMTMNVVMQWARQDPAAAAAWAVGLAEPRLRMPAVSLATQRWSARDPDGARRWALGLPPGGARDDVLVGLVSSPYAQAAPDEEILAAIGDDAARDRALVQTAVRMAGSGRRDEARALVEQRVSSEAMRASARNLLEQATGMSARSPFVPALGPLGVVSGARIATPVPGAGIIAVPPPPPPPRDPSVR